MEGRFGHDGDPWQPNTACRGGVSVGPWRSLHARGETDRPTDRKKREAGRQAGRQAGWKVA